MHYVWSTSNANKVVKELQQQACVRTKQNPLYARAITMRATPVLNSPWVAVLHWIWFWRRKKKRYMISYVKWLQAGLLGIILLTNSPCWLFPAPPRGRQLSEAAIRSPIGTGGPWVKGGEWSRLKETETLSVPNQKRCGTEFKAGMRQTSKLLEFCQCSLPPPSFFKEREKRRERGGEVNENQIHSPVWSGCEQWGGWCQEGFSPYLFLHFDISPSTSEGPFFLTFSFLRKIIFWFEQLSPIDKGMRPQEG